MKFAEMEIVTLKVDDVITTSGECECYDDTFVGTQDNADECY